MSNTDLAMQIAPMIEMAKLLAPAELLPKHLRGKPADLFLTLQLGRELGLAPMQSIRSIHVIEGKPTMSADLMAALTLSRRDVCAYLRPVESTPIIATYETQRVGDKPVRFSFSIEDAKVAGVTGKDNWRKFPAAMLRARCVSALVRAVYPDLMLGVYDPDELGAPVDTADEVEAVNVTVVREADAPPPKKAAGLKAKLGDAAPRPAQDDALALRETVDGIAAWLKGHSATEQDLRAYIEDTQGEMPPPVSKWSLPTAQAVLAKLANGWGQRLAAGLAPPPAVDATPAQDEGAEPFEEMP